MYVCACSWGMHVRAVEILDIDHMTQYKATQMLLVYCLSKQ